MRASVLCLFDFEYDFVAVRRVALLEFLSIVWAVEFIVWF
jgi:hypothetical protein